MVKRVAALIFILGTACFSFFVCLSDSFMDYQEVCNTNKTYADAGYIDIDYNYSNSEQEFSYYLGQASYCDKLSAFYEEIISSKHLNYMEVAKQQIDYRGEFHGSDEFAAGQVNQLINNQYDTPLLSIQIGELTFRSNVVTGFILEGDSFEADDFSYKERKTMPVILGYDYRNYLKIGDTFPINYLVYGEFDAYVAGFYNKGASIQYKDESIILDKYIIAPLFHISEEDTSNKFVQWLSYIKTSCYFYTNSIENYDMQQVIIQQLVNKAKINYYSQGCMRKESKALYFKPGYKDIYLSLGIIGGIVMGVIYFTTRSKWYQEDSFLASDTNLEKIKITNTLKLLLNCFVSFMISCLIGIGTLSMIGLRPYYYSICMLSLFYIALVFIVCQSYDHIMSK
ncbi:hypothetical protein C8E03_10273 [Lachnotalea glycerini]|uniref:MacB-like protein n=1 Tax=Lachnotalea glycerini TaxID=1763509 RepID=A0A318EQT1_9FIRM|nr:hypothetical protein [Lachnotalea glycerini]OYO76073.1 hypothetical protein CG709_16420 [Lachnotalea glycerini]PXV93306.1 hypothetical protein C8E03_10273 [Lachnotalea glycerini]